VVEDAKGDDRRIVVGVDGSKQSKAALRWAVRQAEAIGGVIDAVIVWEIWTTSGMVPMTVVDERGAADAEKILTDELDEVLGSERPVKVETHVVRGNAAGVLIDAASGAELLVVGSHGHGGFAAALLGSVSQHCVHHAPCPVVVVRGDVT